MKQCEWIVCERSGRWAAALRRAIGAQSAHPAEKRPLHEVRSLAELTARLRERPSAVALVEVRRLNLAETLAWLAEANSFFPRARCIALLESGGFDGETRMAVATALLAAGAAEITDSPRHLQSLIAVGRRHAAWQASDSTGFDDRQTFAEWAWGLLPWQPA